MYYNLSLAVVETLFGTAIPAAVLGALAYLVERTEDHSRQLQRLIAMVQPDDIDGTA